MTRAPVQPVFVDRKTAAEMLMISVDTFDTWLRAGFIPAPPIDRGQIVRWHWPSLEERLAGGADAAHHDPSVMGALNVQKGRNRAAA
ncbi:hypothetical protein [Bosea sp. (in: a-proteobacteria)]|uniref:hypothetical protein n=1 Tax=Bosea sp. (in: a-proteobacteria) TaxID=1871050 RepID=UPI002FCBC584